MADVNKNAFQQGAYRPLIDRMQQSSSGGGCLPGPGGFSLPGGSAWPGGVLPTRGREGGCLPGPKGEGGSPWSRGGSPWSRGVSLVRGVCLVPGRGSPETPSPPVNRITDTCKNITLDTTSLRPVIMKCTKFRFFPF